MQRFMMTTFITLAVASFTSSAFGAQTQFFGENWFRYTQVMFDRETQTSRFGVERIYLRYNHKYTDNLDSRITLEFFSSDKDANGAGLKLKDAYVKFSGIIPEGDITVGLQKQYFGRVYDWEYWPIVKALEDQYGVIHGSRDYGVSVGGYFPQHYGTWRVQAINGEGFKNVGKYLNKELAYIADLRLIPYPGFTVGGSFIRENAGPDSAYEKRQYYTGLGRIAKGPVDIWVQYLSGEKGNPDEPTSQMGYMVFPKFHLGSLLDVDLELLGRFDYWDPNTDQENDGSYMYLGGFNYYFSRQEKGTPGVMLQVAFLREQSELEDADPTDEIMVQLRWEWATPTLQ